MEENKPKHPPTESTKDDSSDIEQVRRGKQGPPPEPKATPAEKQKQKGTTSKGETEKGHS